MRPECFRCWPSQTLPDSGRVTQHNQSINQSKLSFISLQHKLKYVQILNEKKVNDGTDPDIWQNPATMLMPYVDLNSCHRLPSTIRAKIWQQESAIIAHYNVAIFAKQARAGRRSGTPTDASTLVVTHRLISSLMRSSDDDCGWPVHSLMLSFHDFSRLPLRWSPSTIPCSMVFFSAACHVDRNGWAMYFETCIK